MRRALQTKAPKHHLHTQSPKLAAFFLLKVDMIVVWPASEKDALNTRMHLQVVELCCEAGAPRRTSFGAALHSHRLDGTNLEAAGQLVGVVSIARFACSHARPADSRGFTALFVHPRMHAALLMAVQSPMHPAL